jgi:hypothetical protein
MARRRRERDDEKRKTAPLRARRRGCTTEHPAVTRTCEHTHPSLCSDSRSVSGNTSRQVSSDRFSEKYFLEPLIRRPFAVAMTLHCNYATLPRERLSLRASPTSNRNRSNARGARMSQVNKDQLREKIDATMDGERERIKQVDAFFVWRLGSHAGRRCAPSWCSRGGGTRSRATWQI